MQRGAMPQRSKIARIIFTLQIALACIVVFVSVSSLVHLYSSGVLSRATFCSNVQGSGGLSPMSSSAISSEELGAMVGKIADLQARVRQRVGKKGGDAKDPFMLSDVLLTMDAVKAHLLRLQKGLEDMASKERLELYPSGSEEEGKSDQEEEEEEKETAPLAGFFLNEEMRKYLRMKETRHGRKNFMGANITVGAIGHACAALKAEVEAYMDYDVGDLCPDDWSLGQRLMAHGCDPLPRRRCLARAPPLYQRPRPRNESLWALPDDRNVRWSKYTCRNFACLQNGTRRGFYKCAGCFRLGEEARRWVGPRDNATWTEADFLIGEVMGIKPGEIRVGLDFSVGVGSFAARMLEHGVHVASATLNLGAPFSETIALRGLIPLYVSVSQRLPFFDNALDLVHTTLFFDGWIDLQFLDFVIFDWDRVLRPGGLLWIDRFFCATKDLDDYLYLFSQLRYKKHRWVVAHKTDTSSAADQLFFSAVLEKPARPF